MRAHAASYNAALVLGLLLCLAPSGHCEILNVSRRLIHSDGTPAKGARVRVLSDYGALKEKTDIEVIADADGVFTVEVAQNDAQWTGHIIVLAEGSAITYEYAVTGRRQGEPLVRDLHLGAPFTVAGKTVDMQGHPVASATVSLIWAHPENWNPCALNSTSTYRTSTPELITRSSADGTWSMMGIVFVYDGRRIPARVVLEAVANHPLRVSTLDAQLDPETGPTDRKTVSVDFTLAPPIRIAGRVVNSETGRPVAGANLARNALFTTLAAPSSLTDREGRFELQILGPRRALWFWVYGEGFASTTVKTAVREQATSDWADTHDLVVRLRPMVPVTGVVQDENGKPPVEPLELQAVYEDRVDTVWKQSGRHLAADSQVAPDGSFNVKLPAGRITVGLCLPPQPMCSSVMFGMAPKNYRLQQVVNIPVAGMRDVLLKTSSPR